MFNSFLSQWVFCKCITGKQSTIYAENIFTGLCGIYVPLFSSKFIAEENCLHHVSNTVNILISGFLHFRVQVY